MIKRFWPLILAVISIVLFLGIIGKNQWQLKHSQSIFIKLQPVDPRSLLQGDYMALRYTLHWNETELQSETANKHLPLSHYLINQPHLLAYVQLDQQHRVVASAMNSKMLDQSQAIRPLALKNPDNQIDHLYPSAQSFLFAEGLADCYAQAEYAEFKVDSKGNAILTSLRGENIAVLDCKKNQAWWQGVAAE